MIAFVTFEWLLNIAVLKVEYPEYVQVLGFIRFLEDTFVKRKSLTKILILKWIKSMQSQYASG